MKIRSIISYIALVGGMSIAPQSNAVETVDNSGDVFTLYFQNNGDNKYADSTWVKYEASTKDWTAEEIAAVKRALNTWDSVIENTPVRKLSVGIFWLDFSTAGIPGALASCNSKIDMGMTSYAAVKDYTVAESVWREGKDTGFPKTFDLYIYCNTLTNFYFGEDVAGKQTNQYDFQTVITHELGHALGFMSLAKSNGTYTKFMSSTHYTALDELMVDADGNRLIDKAMAAEDGKGFRTGESVYLKGTELSVYNPTYWQDGSSFAHIQGDPTAVMQNSINTAFVHRELSDSEVDLLSKMGWAVVPEPSTLTLSMLCLVGALLKRKRVS